MNATEKIQLLERVRTLEGLTDSERNTLLALIEDKKTYGLVWEDKPEDVEQRLKEEYPVLSEVKERAIISDNPDAPNHILIEGDNLEALTTLSYTHAGKIDVIYIDPPYNTGNKDFKYDDTYVDKNDSFRHSKWISFIRRRLIIANRLLSRAGIIFISIDENEYSVLKLLCDTIFGRNNLVTSFIWKSKSGGANDAKFIATDSEYILAYAKDFDVLELLDDEGRTVTTSYNREDEKGKYALDRLDKQSLGYHESLDFPIIGPDGFVYTVFHNDPEHKVARWRWGKDLVKERYGELVFENGCVYTKNYESEGAMPRNLLVEERFGRTRSGKTELFSIVGPNDFNNPKPSKLISYLLSLFPNKNCKVLDFFAGSGTTMTAVMRTNSIDNGKRECILITNNEKQICESVTYPRNVNVIKGYKSKGKSNVILLSEKLTLTKIKKASSILSKIEKIKKDNICLYDSFKTEIKDNNVIVSGILEKNEVVEGLHDNNLRYYKTDFVSRERTQKNRRKLMEKSTDLLCIKEDLYAEKNTFGRIKLNPKGARYFADGKKEMLVIIRSEFIPDFVKEIEKMEPKEQIKIYVYSSGRYAYDDEFAVVADKVKVCALPENIIEAMARVMPDKVSEKEIEAAAPGIQEMEKSEATLFDDLTSEAE